MDPETSMALFSVLFGLALGSFLNVCIYRIPLAKSIVNPPSACPDCGRRIRFYDNIPLLSYIFLSGKCRDCHCRIPLRYPAVEAITGLLSLALFIKFGPGYQYFLYLLFAAMLIIISFIDLSHKIIPNILSYPGIALGLAASFLPGHVTCADSIIGIVAGYGSLFLVELVFKFLTGREGMGRGDAKLLAMIGAWAGWRALPFILLSSSLAGSVIGGIFLLATGKGYRIKIPFGPFLSFGALTYVFFGPELTSWYFHLLR